MYDIDNTGLISRENLCDVSINIRNKEFQMKN